MIARVATAARLGIVAFVGLVVVGCGIRGSTQDSIVLRLAHGLDTSHPVHRAMVFLGEDLARRSAGRMRLEVYPSEQLGSERECVELLQIGSLAMTKISAAVLANFTPTYAVLGLPYVFRDADHAHAVLDGEIGERLLMASLPQRLRGLAFYDAGSRSFYTRTRPIQRPEDLEGLKIRTQESAVAMGMVEALGGAPTPIAWGELYTALQQGVVDGAENNPPSFVSSRHYEVARFFSLDEHTRVPDVLLVSSAVWARLDEAQRGWLRAAARASVTVERRWWREAVAEALETVRAAGVEVIRPDTAPFAGRVDGLLATYRRDPEIATLLDAIAAVGPRE